MKYLWLVILAGCASIEPKIVQMTPRVQNNLAFLYDRVQIVANTEFAFCAFGHVRGDTISIESIELSQISHASSVEVDHNPESCESDSFLGKGHSHPPSDTRCYLSDLDWLTFASKPYRFDFLVCANRRFSVFTRRAINAREVPYARGSANVDSAGPAHPGRPQNPAGGGGGGQR